ncbi:rhomboid family intramembrane serine protease [Hyunsoonleella sp. SJ7]|uniref:Rhomboid family intramembrane serine protease n=1 Tax=Hyunsoonleella aquatilis TaxID=2762758 RepID=A0A923H881_9FLAO|nr:rhomboid family intramembrane serine protease [Hyunsoonleella aquatilis]MBC3758836.1 rhomboid family intramembrane serine protease [Hyunsoonleella aquatilis]
MGKLDIITVVIIAANVIISYKGFGDFGFFEKYKFNIGAIRRGEQIRMFSSGFLHADTTHLFFNMFALYLFADQVLYEVGQYSFFIIYIGSLLAGNMLSLYFHKNEYHYSAVGASGAVTGVLYSAILLNPQQPYYFLFLPPRIGDIDLGIPGFVLGIAYLLYSIYGMKRRIGNIGHDAHFGGAIGGYIITLILVPTLFQTDILMVGVLALPIVLLFVLRRLGKI